MDMAEKNNGNNSAVRGYELLTKRKTKNIWDFNKYKREKNMESSQIYTLRL